MKKAVALIASASGVVIPAWQFFTAYAPPAFPSITLITAAIGTALALVIHYAPPLTVPEISRRGLALIFVSLALLIAYVTLLPQLTVADPRDGMPRIQVGLGRS